VIALHGDGDTNSSFIATSTLASLTESKGFVLAAPQGITQTIMKFGQTIPNVDWDSYRDVGEGNIDLPLLEAIRTQLVASTSIDPKHVIVFGYSQGGYMSFRYGMDASASLACTAVIAAGNPLGATLTAAAPRKVPVSLQVGTLDTGALQSSRDAKTDLTTKGFPLDYHEIAGGAHSPLPGGVTGPLTYCLGQALP
jgi:poly(3-hydroxybutyrate) depolymerase